MKFIMNERGASSLTYVLMIFMVLAIITPVIMTTTTSSALDIKRSNNAKIVNYLAASGMEAFISYLDAYKNITNVTRDDYLAAFPMGAKTLRSPEGNSINYELIIGTKQADDSILVTSRATTASPNLIKEINYTITSKGVSSGTTITTDPTKRVSVPASTNKIYVDGAITGAPESFAINKDSNLSLAIQTTLNTYKSTVNSAVTNYESQAVVCNCTNEIDITNAINASSANPVILKINNDIDIYTYNTSLSWGTSQKPVILIFKKLTFSNKTTLVLNGDLIVKNDFTITGYESSVRVNKAGNPVLYGNLYTQGAFVGNNKIAVNVANIQYSDSMNIIGYETTLVANKLITAGSFLATNKIYLTATTDIIAKSMTLSGYETSITSTGDLLVQNDFISNNKSSLNSGGNIAVGGSFTNYGYQSSINSGGGTTTLIVNNSGSGSGGGGSGGNIGWNPRPN